MSSSMLEQAIIDAKELKEAAQKNAEETVVEKYQAEIKEAVDKILEQEEGMDMGMGPGADPGGAGGGTPESAKQPEASDDQLTDIFMQLPFIQTTPDSDIVELNLDRLEETLDERLKNILSENEGLEEIDLDEDLDSLLDEDLFEEDYELEEDLGLEEDYELEEDFGVLDEDEVTLNLGPEQIANLAAQFSKASAEGVSESTNLNESILESLLEEAEQEMAATGKVVDVGKQKAPHQLKNKNSKLIKEQKILVREQKQTSTKLNSLEEKLDKYTTAITKLKNRLEESNLENARLFYQNRVLDSVSLNERQKDKIVETIKGASSVEEAKIIFETLQSTVGGAASGRKTPDSLNEVVYRGSSAFMPLREEKQKVSDPFVARMKTLAGLKKD